MTFDFDKGYVLENDVVLLRPLMTSDVAYLQYFAMEEPELWTYSMVSATGLSGMQSYIDEAIHAKKQKTSYPFIVFDKREKKYAGCTRFYDIQFASGGAHIGYTWYGKAFQGTGINQHCKYLMLDFAFEQMDLYRIEFRADARNIRSINAMKKIGCTVEGILRSNGYCSDGTRRDSIVLSILREEWFSKIKENLSASLTF